MAALDQMPAQVGDVSLRASSRRVNPLKVQGQVHGSVLGSGASSSGYR